MMGIVGYASIRKNATTGHGAIDVDKFKGQQCPVMEFDKWGGVLVMSPEGNELCMFDKLDVVSSFECAIEGNYIVPPGLDFLQRTVYVTRCMERRGGYSDILRRMVVAASIMKGKFTDDFLWQLQ